METTGLIPVLSQDDTKITTHELRSRTTHPEHELDLAPSQPQFQESLLAYVCLPSATMMAAGGNAQASKAVFRTPLFLRKCTAIAGH
jgi:hypothetical protein